MFLLSGIYTRRSGSMFSWRLGVLAEFGFILSEARFTKLKQALRNYFIVLVFYHSDWFRGWVCICVVPNLIDSTFVMRPVSFRLDECYGYLVTLYWAATNRPLYVMLKNFCLPPLNEDLNTMRQHERICLLERDRMVGKLNITETFFMSEKCVIRQFVV